MKYAFLVLLVSVLMVSAPVSVNADCNDPQTTVEMTNCEQARYDRADAQLNQAYQQLKTVLNSANLEELKLVQRAWVKYRDANASFYYQYQGGGSMRDLAALTVMTDMTEQRTRELRELLENQ